MPRKNCEIKRDKTSQKVSDNRPKEKFNYSKKRTVNKEAGIPDGADSLVFLKDTSGRKKFDDFDSRIKLLKSKLQSLLDVTEHDEVCDIQGKNISERNKVERPKELESKKVPENFKHLKKCAINTVNSTEFEPSSSSTPHKFTEWLDSAINEANSQCQTETITLSETNNSPFTSEVQAEESTSNRFSQNKVEELLYKSFIVQNGLEDLTLPYESSKTKNKRLKRKINKEKYKSEENSKKHCSVNLVQGKNKYLKSSKRGRKKRRISSHDSESVIEVIDLESTLMGNGEPSTDSNSTDFDISNYDWSEPFDIENDHFKNDSDVQVISESETKDDPVNKSRLKAKSLQQKQETEAEQKEGNENADNEKPEAKKVWECPVCLEQSKGQEIVATQCGHVFCKTCLEGHITKIKRNCPTCRADLKNKPIITLFNF